MAVRVPVPPAGSAGRRRPARDRARGAAAGPQRSILNRLRRRLAPLGRVFAWIEGDQPPETGAPERFRTAVAILIALVSVLGAIVAWRASIYASDASDLDQRATQELVRREQVLASSRGSVAQDRRFLPLYQQHVKAAVLLDRDARALRATDAVRAAELRAQAEEERALARVLVDYFFQFPDSSSSGNVSYDAAGALRYLEATDPDLPILHPAAVAAQAQRIHDRTVRLVGVAAVFVVALFLLTLAELTRPAIRPAFAAGGVAAMVAGLTLFLVIGP